MKILHTTAVVAFISVSAISPVAADSANWSEEKAAKVDANRNSNAGIGNGGERKTDEGDWVATNNGEDGSRDVDPGNSAGNNQACSGGGSPSESSC
ncbi:hypothetical protein [Marinibacterium profundimaris]|uniref:Secreted protein n=1 Tax=Marinibacterium profundimaris TaxID=1679460 RepID=A0A225NFS2_9RHOB|nr:hypothetical protein [Marinibacterium profundimaris]OWU72226.1 hypothetical protein ATO3_16790 [Marinibacterium profundimaris]